jgi:inorganic pyrophosphatase
MKKNLLILGMTVLFTLFLFPGCQRAIPGTAEGYIYKDLYTLDGGMDLVSANPAMNQDGTVNAVVEIPAGTIAKWEVNGTLPDGTRPDDGRLRWEFDNGKPRVIQYLGYPGNYGFIPCTLGGDDDQLDILLVGPPLPKGAVSSAKFIGVLKMLDGGDTDDKILAVTKESPLYGVNDLADLDDKFPGVRDIIEIWFTHYKGQGEMKAQGWGDIEEAELIIQKAIDNFVR